MCKTDILIAQITVSYINTGTRQMQQKNSEHNSGGLGIKTPTNRNTTYEKVTVFNICF